MKGRKFVLNITLVCLLITTAISQVMITEGMHYQTTYEILNGEDVTLDLDYSFIWNTTENLSKYGYDYVKGREFGTQGEHLAAAKIIELMQSPNFCNLENVNYPIIENICYPFQNIFYGGEELASKLSTNYQYIKFNNINNPSETFSLENTFINPLTDNWEFFIHPSWNNSSIDPKFEYSDLSCTFSYSDLQIVYAPNNIPGIQSLINIFITSKYSTILNSYNNIIDDPFSTTSLEDIIIDELENYFSFHIDDLDPDNTSNWPSFFEIPSGVTGDYVLISEDPAFNPNKENILPQWEQGPLFKIISELGLRKKVENIIRYIFTIPSEKKLRACIFFDFHNNTFDMNLHPGTPVPIIYINGSKGGDVNSSIEDYTLDLQLTQEWNEQVESYNVIGEIPGVDNTKTVIISSLYDCWWNNGTADAATGMGIVLGIAKYLKKIDITPKYKVKFIAFGGEEYGSRGAKYYNALHGGQTASTPYEFKDNNLYLYTPNGLIILMKQ